MDYELEKKSTLGKSTLLKYVGVLKAFVEFKGNIDVADFNRKLLQNGRAATTVNEQMSILNSFFDYCISNKQANMINPAKDLNIVGAHNKVESYEPFKLAELGRIFQPDLYLKKMKLPDFYWGPLVGLFTGARAEEIASLDLAQVYPEKGIWVIDILDGKTGRTATRKTCAERVRRVSGLARGQPC